MHDIKIVNPKTELGIEREKDEGLRRQIYSNEPVDHSGQMINAFYNRVHNLKTWSFGPHRKTQSVMKSIMPDPNSNNNSAILNNDDQNNSNLQKNNPEDAEIIDTNLENNDNSNQSQ